ncbi:MAG: ISL3 family transposase [Acidiferrobacterales bacterium]
MPVNILNLPAYTVTAIDRNDNDYHIDAVVKEPPQNCPHCGSGNLVGFGRREQMVRDMPTHGRRVGICVNTRRFQCRACGKTFYETLPEMDERRPMTQRMVKWIGKQAIKRTFASIAAEVGLDEKSVRSIFRDCINELEKTVRFETPQWMGIDEVQLIRPRGVIADIQNSTIVELLPNRNRETVANYLSQLEGKDRIQYVAMDMWAPYRDACMAVIPQARIVIDKFRVVRMANEAMERARKSLRERLTPKERRGLMHDRFVLLKRERDLNDKERLLMYGWFRIYPELGEAYRLKEDFFAIYETPLIGEAQDRYSRWKRGMSKEAAVAFGDLVRTWDNWEPWILGYFDHPVTNAYTKSLNKLIQVMNRLGRGYSFEALRAKILFSEGVHKMVKPRPEFECRGIAQESTGCALLSPSMFEEVMEKNSGADISILARKIEAGEL